MRPKHRGWRDAPPGKGTHVDQKEIDDYNAARAAADEVDAKTTVTPEDVKSVDEKLLAFATGLGAGERKHLFSLLDRPEAGADVQGFWWHDTWRVRFWRGPWGWRR
jgi:hypothetical protein